MNILLLFIFNLFTGALIYLILTLKIEKNSATFQEKKLKREMAEIIREFNSTAERNITILEAHISTLKKLMNENGSLKGVDYTVLDTQFRNNSIKKGGENTLGKINQKIINDPDSGIIKSNVKSLKHGVSVKDTLLNKDYTFKSDEDIDFENDKKAFIKNKESQVSPSEQQKIDVYADEEIIINYENEKPVDISDLFQNAEDKYLLIAKLYSEGHSVEDISKYSGLPSGEIKLVISLNS